MGPEAEVRMYGLPSRAEIRIVGGTTGSDMPQAWFRKLVIRSVVGGGILLGHMPGPSPWSGCCPFWGQNRESFLYDLEASLAHAEGIYLARGSGGNATMPWELVVDSTVLRPQPFGCGWPFTAFVAPNAALPPKERRLKASNKSEDERLLFDLIAYLVLSSSLLVLWSRPVNRPGDTAHSVRRRGKLARKQ